LGVRGFVACWVAVLGVMASGCASYPRAQNPLPGVFRVAVVDFVDKTNGAEGADCRRITEVFASELQKIPTYEVVPVQEVREVLGPLRIDTNQPQLAFELARAVHAQAIIVGSVNEYNAHYPPRMALHCEMYAMVTGEPDAVVQMPPIEMDKDRQPLRDLMGALPALPGGKERFGERVKHPHRCGHCSGCKSGKACCGHGTWGRVTGWWHRKSVVPTESANEGVPDAATGETPVPAEPSSATGEIQQTAAVVSTPTSDAEEGSESLVSASPAPIQQATGTPTDYLSGQIPDYQVAVRQAVDPIPIVEPWVIRHSRVFDSTNLGLSRKLKDYYFFNDDLRGGHWQGYVLRNEDFIRFSCNQMIYEMLDAAGGDWFTLRGVRLPSPWYPWPPR
jgi:hypothetical protein